MIKDYTYYVEKYLKTLSKMRLAPSDYSDPKFSTREHNRAIDQFNLLEIELEKHRELADKVYSELMEINDIKVQFYAASYCLKLSIHIERAVEILEHMRKTNENWAVMLAEGTLKMWHGKIEPNNPFQDLRKEGIFDE